jgi:hypothetical protein
LNHRGAGTIISDTRITGNIGNRLGSIVLLGLLLATLLTITVVTAGNDRVPAAIPAIDPCISHPLPQAYPTPDPGARWTRVGEALAGDWLVFATGGDISAIVPDGNVISAASDGGLLRWDRETNDLAQYTAPYIPLPNNNVRDMAFSP